MEYLKEAKEIFEKFLHDFGLYGNKEEVSEFLKEKGITVESIAKDLDTGVNNGYSIDKQMAIINQLTEKLL